MGPAVGLLEPWACVERAYATEERATLKPDGKTAIAPGFARAGAFSEGVAVVRTPEQRVGVIDVKGGWLVPNPR